ncbi:MAG: hypothetical protein ACK46L_02990 [Synechococcaceae cyanobacterium]
MIEEPLDQAEVLLVGEIATRMPRLQPADGGSWPRCPAGWPGPTPLRHL